MLAKEGMAMLPLLLLMFMLLLLMFRLLLLTLMLPFRMFSKFCDLGTALKKLWMSCNRQNNT
jgi:hypothetical protein